MKIAIDGGALTKDKNKQFGNYTFATNIIRALKTYDKNNKYIIYTFDNLKPKYLWLKFRVSIEEILQKNDVFLALNQALPLYTRGIKICFCHGLSYYFYKSLYSQNDYVRLSKQLNEMIKISDYIIVSSLKIKKELLTINRSINNKIVVLPFGVPSDILKVKKFNRSVIISLLYF